MRKVCPIVARIRDGQCQVLAFLHPLAGKQFVKGTIEIGEQAYPAAVRELAEESGIIAGAEPIELGTHPIGSADWHFFLFETTGLPDAWEHWTDDDGGRSFAFFWHSLKEPLGADWHSQFHEAFAVVQQLLSTYFRQAKAPPDHSDGA